MSTDNKIKKNKSLHLSIRKFFQSCFNFYSRFWLRNKNKRATRVHTQMMSAKLYHLPKFLYKKTRNNKMDFDYDSFLKLEGGNGGSDIANFVYKEGGEFTLGRDSCLIVE